MIAANQSPEISVLLPTYNERDNIVPLIGRIQKVLEGPYEILVIDDDSPDGTWKLVKEVSERDQRVRLIHRTQEKGLTSALLTGLHAARGEIVAWMDCDLSMPPEILPFLIRKIPSYDLAVGSRYIPGGQDIGHSWMASFSSRLICKACSWLLDPAIKDYTSGYIVGRKKTIMDIGLKGDYGEYCIRLLYQAVRNGYKVIEIPYTFKPRHTGKSKTFSSPIDFFLKGRKYLYTLLALKLGQ
jgi:dolichol-phosphate mannosyltransferase